MTGRQAGLLIALCAAAGSAGAQEPSRDAPNLTIALRRDSAGAVRAPIVQATGLPGGVFVGALRSGYPVRLGFSLQLWRNGRLVDPLEREAAWEAVVILDPLTQSFELLRSGGGTPEAFSDQASLERALATPFAVELLPSAPDNREYYFIATLTIESLNVSELEDIERWLRGDLGPAIGERDVNNALSRGARLLMIRLSGLPRRQLEARSPSFRY